MAASISRSSEARCLRSASGEVERFRRPEIVDGDEDVDLVLEPAIEGLRRAILFVSVPANLLELLLVVQSGADVAMSLASQLEHRSSR